MDGRTDGWMMDGWMMDGWLGGGTGSQTAIEVDALFAISVNIAMFELHLPERLACRCRAKPTAESGSLLVKDPG